MCNTKRKKGFINRSIANILLRFLLQLFISICFNLFNPFELSPCSLSHVMSLRPSCCRCTSSVSVTPPAQCRQRQRHKYWPIKRSLKREQECPTGASFQVASLIALAFILITYGPNSHNMVSSAVSQVKQSQLYISGASHNNVHNKTLNSGKQHEDKRSLTLFQSSK